MLTVDRTYLEWGIYIGCTHETKKLQLKHSKYIPHKFPSIVLTSAQLCEISKAYGIRRVKWRKFTAAAHCLYKIVWWYLGYRREGGGWGIKIGDSDAVYHMENTVKIGALGLPTGDRCGNIPYNFWMRLSIPLRTSHGNRKNGKSNTVH